MPDTGLLAIVFMCRCGPSRVGGIAYGLKPYLAGSGSHEEKARGGVKEKISRYAVSIIAVVTAMIYLGTAWISTESSETGWAYFYLLLMAFYAVIAVLNLPESAE